MISHVDVIGVAGGILLTFGYYRVSSGRWKGTSFFFELDNLIASACLIYYTYRKEAYVNIALNIIWGVVAIKGLSSLGERRIKKMRRK